MTVVPLAGNGEAVACVEDMGTLLFLLRREQLEPHGVHRKGAGRRRTQADFRLQHPGVGRNREVELVEGPSGGSGEVGFELVFGERTARRPRPLPVVCTCSNRARTCKVPRAYFPGSTGTVWVMVTFSGTGFVVRMRRPLPFLPYSGAQSTRVPEETG